MPLLAQEIDLFPSQLLVDPPVEGTWWAMYTLARREKELMRRLLSQRIAFYGPVFEQVYRSPAGRLRSSFLPLFPNYVFIHGDESDRYSAIATGCVSRCLAIPDQTGHWEDLRVVDHLLNSGLDITAESQLLPGQSVRVKNGPLTGQLGRIIERRGQTRLLVTVNFLQQGASVEIEGFDLEPWT
jgi:transcription antitermination factor NusG